jgi:hypothetical protein
MRASWRVLPVLLFLEKNLLASTTLLHYATAFNVNSGPYAGVFAKSSAATTFLPLQKITLPRASQRNNLSKTMCSSSKDGVSGGGGELPMTFLQQRIAEMQTAEVLKDRRCAKNWREGRCSTRAVAVLEDDWIRQVRMFKLSTFYCCTRHAEVAVPFVNPLLVWTGTFVRQLSCSWNLPR